MSASIIQKKPMSIWLIFSFFVAALSIYGMYNVFLDGQEAAYGISREVPWGILIIGYSFLVGISAGTAIIGSLAHVFKIDAFHVMSKRVALVSLAALVGAFFIIFWELAGPYQLQTLRLLAYYTNFEITSPIWWMVTLYMIELPLLAIEVYFLVSKKHESAFFASLIGLFLGVIAYSTLAFVFASNATRPLWHSTSFSLFFIISATTAGAAIVLIMIFISGRGNALKTNVMALSKMLFLGLCLMFFVNTWNVLLNTYGVQSELTKTMLLFVGDGPLAFNFYYLEIGLGIILPIILLIIGGFKSPFLSAFAGIFMVIGMFFSRFDTIVGGQLLSRPHSHMDFILHTYQVSGSELSIFIGGLGIAGLVFFFGEKYIDLEEETH
jgi:molybdopterin-containing oxidoreductase family membrane subunit